MGKVVFLLEGPMPYLAGLVHRDNNQTRKVQQQEWAKALVLGDRT